MLTSSHQKPTPPWEDIAGEREAQEKAAALKKQMEMRLKRKQENLDKAASRGKKAADAMAEQADDSDAEETWPKKKGRGARTNGEDGDENDGGKEDGDANTEAPSAWAFTYAPTLDDMYVNCKEFARTGKISCDTATILGDRLDFTELGYSEELSEQLYQSNIVLPMQSDAEEGAEHAENRSYKHLVKWNQLPSSDRVLSPLAKQLVEALMVGPNKVANFFGSDFKNTDWHKILVARNIYQGPDNKWVGFGDFLWGKTIVLHSGGKLICGVPFKSFLGDVKAGKTLGDICDTFTAMTKEEIVSRGGFLAFIQAGTGISCPPGYLLAEVNYGALETDEDDEPDFAGVDCVDLWLMKIRK